MSIIHQALKKAQTNKMDDVLSMHQEPAVKEEKSTARNRNFPFLIIVFCIIFAAAAIAGWRIVIWQGGYSGAKNSGGAAKISSLGVAPSKMPLSIKKESAAVKEKGNDIKSAASPAAALEKARNKNLNGMKLYKQGKFSLAKNEFLASIEIFPEYAVAYNNLGLTYKQLGDMKGAENSYKNALRHKPDYPEAMNNYGVLLEAKGDSKTAREYLKKAILISRDYPEPYLNMAVSLERDNRFEDAITYYEGFLSHLSVKQAAGKDDPIARDVRERLIYLNANANIFATEKK